MTNPGESDEAVVERARRRVSLMTKFRWGLLVYGMVFLGVTIYWTTVVLWKIDNLKPEQLKVGFVYGLALGLSWTTFGIIGGLCIGKFLAGVAEDYRESELLVRYYDRLRGLNQLPASQKASADVHF